MHQVERKLKTVSMKRRVMAKESCSAKVQKVELTDNLTMEALNDIVSSDMNTDDTDVKLEKNGQAELAESNGTAEIKD